MNIFKHDKIDKVWANICAHEGETFYTKTHREYTYVIKGDYIIFSIPSKTKISKTYFEKALEMNVSMPSEINLRGQSYIYGIITDSRIK